MYRQITEMLGAEIGVRTSELGSTKLAVCWLIPSVDFVFLVPLFDRFLAFFPVGILARKGD